MTYLILNKQNKVVAEKKTLKEAEDYVKERPYLRFESFAPPTDTDYGDLDDIF